MAVYHNLELHTLDGGSFQWLEQDQLRLLPSLTRLATRSWIEGIRLHLELPLSKATVDHLLRYVKGQKEQTDWLATERVLAELAGIQELEDVREQLIRELVKKKTSNNCIGLWKMTTRLGSSYRHEMLDYCLSILVRAVQQKTIDIHFYRLSETELRLLLSADKLRVRSEMEVYNVLKIWVDAWPESRLSLLPSLINVVRKSGLPWIGTELDDCILSLLPGRQSKEKILVIGGWEDRPCNSLFQLDYLNKRWDRLELKMPYLAGYHGAVLLNGTLYIFGGGDNQTNHYSQLYRLNSQQQWEQLASMREKRCFISNSNVELDGQIWVMGGHNGNRTVRTRLRTVEKYCPKKDEWTVCPPMRHSRSDAAATTLNGKIFVCGGFNGREIIASVEWFDPKSEIWTEMTRPLPAPRSGLCLITDGQSLIALGGTSGLERFATVWRCQMPSGRWQQLPSMKMPRSNFTVSRLGDELVVAGGYCDSIVAGSEIYDGIGWRDGPSFDKGRSALRAVTLPHDYNLI